MRIARIAGYVLLACLLAVSNCVIVLSWKFHGSKDWANFWAAGATAGTPDLLDARRHAAWQMLHHLVPQAFVYPPAVAWFFVPASHLPLQTGFVLNIVAALAAAVFAGVIAARIYGLTPVLSIVAVLCWAPVSNAALLGQHTAIALVLAFLAIYGLMCRNSVIAGLAVGLLLYKPTEALAFVVLVAVRREWRALAIVGGCSLVWYFASVAATAGDWKWPLGYVHMLHGYYQADFTESASRAVSLPGVMMYIGVPDGIAWAAGAALLAASAVRLARAPLLEAASMAGLIGVAVSPHAWPYDAVLLLPGIFYVITSITGRWRTQLVAAAYVIAPMWVFSSLFRFDPLAIVVLGGTALWLAA
jgi:hypothetical protein